MKVFSVAWEVIVEIGTCLLLILFGMVLYDKPNSLEPKIVLALLMTSKVYFTCARANLLKSLVEYYAAHEKN